MQSLTQRRASPHPSGSSGFTIVEILLALALGSVLVTSVASGLQLFGEELEHVRNQPDARLDEAVVLVSERVRDAWWAEMPSANQLDLADASGNVTSFSLVGDELKVTRPNGAEGVLLEGVASIDVDTEIIQRLRDDPVTTVDGPWFTRQDPMGMPVELTLTEGDAIAFGFHMSDDAPDYVDTVVGVEEERLKATVDTISLTVSFLDGSLKEFCHLHATPPHNPEHPGYVGGRLTAELYEARAPDDARPYGPMLGTIDIDASELPPTSFVWWDQSIDEQAFPPDAADAEANGEQCADADEDGKCDHKGNNKHKNPIDVPGGVAWGWWSNHPDVDLLVAPTSVDVDVDLSQFGVAIEPGKAYTVAFKVHGWDQVRVRAIPVLSSKDSGVAMQLSSGSFVPQALAIPIALSGSQTCTQTESHDTVSRVSFEVTMADGRKRSASSVVQGQVAVSDPWRGVVPQQIGDVGP